MRNVCCIKQNEKATGYDPTIASLRARKQILQYGLILHPSECEDIYTYNPILRCHDVDDYDLSDYEGEQLVAIREIIPQNGANMLPILRKTFYRDLDQIYPPGSFLNAFFKDEDFVEALAEAPAEAEEVLIEIEEEEEEDYDEYDYDDSLYDDLDEYLAALEEEEEEKEKEEEDEEEINIIIWLKGKGGPTLCHRMNYIWQKRV